MYTYKRHIIFAHEHLYLNIDTSSFRLRHTRVTESYDCQNGSYASVLGCSVCYVFLLFGFLCIVACSI